jgi:hypothetical protein
MNNWWCHFLLALIPLQFIEAFCCTSLRRQPLLTAFMQRHSQTLHRKGTATPPPPKNTGSTKCAFKALSPPTFSVSSYLVTTLLKRNLNPEFGVFDLSPGVTINKFWYSCKVANPHLCGQDNTASRRRKRRLTTPPWEPEISVRFTSFSCWIQSLNYCLTI